MPHVALCGFEQRVALRMRRRTRVTLTAAGGGRSGNVKSIRIPAPRQHKLAPKSHLETKPGPAASEVF